MANVYLGRNNKVGKLSSIDFEDETQESFGVSKIEDFNQKNWLTYMLVLSMEDV